MTPQEFRKFWEQQPYIELYTFTPNQLDSKKITKDIVNFLTTYGIPFDAAPGFSFNDYHLKELQTPDQYFGFNDPKLKNYLVIGINGSGDPVCIDVDNNDEIVFLNHDYDFNKTFVNSNIEKFVFCLTAYCEFVDEVNSTGLLYFENGADENQIGRIKDKLLAIDERCLENESLWSMELAARQRYNH